MKNTLANSYFAAVWIVSPDPTQGNQTTIAGAGSVASAGDTIFIREGTYTENVTFTAGVNYVALINSAGSSPAATSTAVVTINGNQTFSTAGRYNVSGINFTATSGNPITVSGSAAVNVNFASCYIHVGSATGTGFSFTNSSSSSNISVSSCTMDLVSGASYYTATGAGSLYFTQCDLLNSGASTAASNSSSSVTMRYSTIRAPLSTSSGGGCSTTFCLLTTAALNVTAITITGTGTFNSLYSTIQSGTAIAVSIGAGTFFVPINTQILSSNANPITNAGILLYGPISFSSTGTIGGVATNVPLPFGPNIYLSKISFDAGTDLLGVYLRGRTYTPTLTGATTAGTTTYSLQFGQYTQIGSRVFLDVYISYTAATGTGNAQISLPIAAATITNSSYVGAVAFTNITLAGTDYFSSISSAATAMTFLYYSSASAPVNLAIGGPVLLSTGVVQASINYLVT